ncbi:MAG TPA: hypothetical protein VK447_12595 [Myxococcaceae bacterium]|nr:hypothetical protein [Myxococcaceae bacterium]
MSHRRALLPLLLALLGLVGCPSAKPPSELPSEISDDNDSQATATSVTPSDWHEGAIDPVGDVDFYALRVTAGRTYRFTCVPETLGACRVEWVNPRGAVGMVAEPPYVVEGKRGYTTGVSALAGTDATWYVVVSAGERGTPRYNGTYRYRLEELGPDDHGDTLESATALNPAGEVGLGTAERPRDVDLFSFTAEAGAAYRFECRGATWRPHCLLDVMDAQGRSIPELKPWGFTVPAAGTWYVRRAEDSTWTQGPEVFWYALVRLPEDHGDTAATATPVPFPGVLEGRLDGDNPRDSFSFAGRAKQIFHLRFNGPCKAGYQVWDPTGQRVPIVRVTRNPFVPDLFGVLPVDGRYVIGLASPTTCPYSASLDYFGTDEVGGTPETAATLGVGGVSNHIMPMGDVDLFRLQMDARRVYRIRCAGLPDWPDAPCQIGLETDTPVAITDDTTVLRERLVRVKSNVDQTVSVRVTGVVGSVFRYTLEVTELELDDHGDTPETASALAPGASVSGVHELLGDRDDFSATLEPGRAYAVSLEPTGAQPAPALYVYPPGAGTRVLVTPPYAFTAEPGVYTFESESGWKDPAGYVLRVESR